MNDDLQLFIIWNHGRRLEADILKDLADKFEIIKIFEIFWSKEQFPKNLSRFYGKNLRKGRKKLRECGTGPFLTVVVRDKNPQYADGKNYNMSSAKYFYRQMFGGGFMIHASDSSEEAFENLLFLTGQNINDYAAAQPSAAITQLKTDLIGTVGWKDAESLKKIIALLPQTELNTAPKIWTLNTDTPEQARRIINARKCWFGSKLNYITVSGRKQKIRISLSS